MINSYPTLFFSNGVPLVGRFYRNTQNWFTKAAGRHRDRFVADSQRTDAGGVRGAPR
jgi:hypothetical protein